MLETFPHNQSSPMIVSAFALFAAAPMGSASVSNAGISIYMMFSTMGKRCKKPTKNNKTKTLENISMYP